jgi:hypothetical protein
MIFAMTSFYAVEFERMKEKILTHDAVVPDIAQDEWDVAGLIQKLLAKHSFFADLSVVDLLEKRVKQEYRPDPRHSGKKKKCLAGEIGMRASFHVPEVVVEMGRI